MSNCLPSPVEQQLSFELLEAARTPQSVTHPPVSGVLGKTHLVKPFKFASSPYEYKVIALRESPTPEEMQLGDNPQRLADYWNLHIANHPQFDCERECFVVLLLNTRRRIKGHQFVSTGTIDSVVVNPRDVFRLALMTSAACVALAHNHPSGDASPSAADVHVTRELIRAGNLLKIEVLDHLVIGRRDHSSLRDMGYFEM